MSKTVATQRRVGLVGLAVTLGLASTALGAPVHAEGGGRTAGPDSWFVSDAGDLGAALFGSVDDPDFISRTTDFGLFTLTSAADPDDDNYVAVVLQTAWFTDILTSGTDPEDNLGFGAASIGVAGETVNTFIVPGCPDLDSTFALPFTDPFAELFTDLIQLGLV
ncbi:hypothetical protein BST33_13385 [Mycolicibacter minnesotensis]|uniref:Uncharacterized protein n=1 Tax=Mycolicibacter minnesotensis TaxID=1118379 RepID=A0A7I7R2Q4_9MYCO|nr:hypothetical protein [Mycolicibacter minnesotensis]ORA99763.1 hypothetical protein BST33_13385 [Mycolicibacter minnesotensis]BBY32943.1 hypothetical protein MMIN_10040 [Mycolicibacter minnesotensis]